MSGYRALVSVRFRMLLQYRAAAFAGFVTQLFWGAIRLMILAAFYAAATRPQPISLPELIPYVWLGQALLGLLPWNVDQEIAASVRTGGVAYEMLRPIDLYLNWFARTLAFRCAGTLLRMVPLVLCAMLVMPLIGLQQWAMPPPAGVAAAAFFCASLCATVLLSVAVTMLMHIGLIWTLAGDGFNRAMPGIVSVLSGMTIPLPLFPAWMQPFLQAQPLRGLADVPYRIYSGHIADGAALLEIAQQFTWAFVLIACGYALLHRGVGRLVVQGG